MYNYNKMTREQNVKKMTKNNKTSKKQEELARRTKSNDHSDSDSNYSDEEDDNDDSGEMNTHEYRKFLQKMFPSKHLQQKIDAGNKLKNLLKNKKSKRDDDEESDDDDSEEEENVVIIKNNKNNNNNNKKSNKKDKKRIVESDSDEEDDDDDDDEDNGKTSSKGNKFNIVFTIANGEKDDEDEWEDYDDDDSEYDDEDEETEDEDVSVSTDDTDSDDDDDDDDEEEEEEFFTKKHNNRNKHNKSKNKNNKDRDEDTDSDEEDNADKKDLKEKKEGNNENVSTVKELNDDFLQQLLFAQEKDKGNKIIAQCIKTYKAEVKAKVRKSEKKLEKQKEKNVRIFRRSMRDKNTMNDREFFEKLSVDQQKKTIKELKEINKIIRVEKPYRLTLLDADIPAVFKAAAMTKISSLRYMEPGSGEYYKIKNWVDTFMRIPFNKYNTLPVNISDGVDVCHEFMERAQSTLNSAVYGLNDAKIQIMQMLGQLITNPAAIGTAIAIHGPPGTGKTSLVKEGISKILNRPFAFIALGGATDSSFLEGHSYTYEGSMWGKIVQIIIDSKCMNPVIYFDELDKISDTPKGEEIAGILTHLTDTSQNTQFHDKFFAEVEFDLSKCLFIFSYNDENKINPILRDRMYRIETKGYNQKQKTVISNQYLLPKIQEQVKFRAEDIIIPDETIHYLIDNHCNKEDGVRNMKRCLEIIYTKLNLYRLMKPGTNLFEEDMSLKVEFPFTVTKDIVDKLIKKENNNDPSRYSLYV